MSYRLNQAHGLRVSMSAGLRPSTVNKAVFLAWIRLSDSAPAFRSAITLDRYPLTEATERSRIGVMHNSAYEASTIHINNSSQAFQYQNTDRALFQDLDAWVLMVAVVNLASSGADAKTWYVRDVSGTMTGTVSADPGDIGTAVAGPMEFIDIGSAITVSQNNSAITQATTDLIRWGPCAILIGADPPTEAEVEAIRGGRGFNSLASTGTPLAVFTGTDLVDKINGITLAPFGGAAIANFDTTNEPVCFVWEPTAQTVAESATATFSVWAVAPTATYQWQREPAAGGGFTDISGATSRTYTGAATLAANNGDKFRCRLNPAGANVISKQVTLTVTGGAPVLSSPVVVSTGNGIATVRFTTDTAPTGSSILAVQVLPEASATPTSAAILAAPTQTITSGASGARDFSLTGLTNGTPVRAHATQTSGNVVSTAAFTPSTVPGAPTIGTATAGNAQATVNGTAPASNGGATITGYRSTATPGGSTVTGASLPITHTGLTNGVPYTFALEAQNTRGYGAPSAASNSVTPSAPGTAPSITVQPANQTVTAPTAATFSVTATGSGLTYQWRRNGSNISGATSASYTTPATTVSGGSANNGDLYSVVVTGDTAPSATSANATLTVNAPAPPPPPPSGPTLPAVATDATGSTRRTGQTTRMVVEPFTSIEALGTGTRTIATGTTDAVTGEITLTGLASGTYAVLRFFPSTGATIQGVSFRLVVVP